MASLIEDLAGRLDVSPEQARRQLDELVSAFRSHVERKGRSTLPDLGTFSKGDGNWSFEPTEALARTVNRSFDDLQPVGVSSGASSTPASEESRAGAAHEDQTDDAPEPPASLSEAPEAAETEEPAAEVAPESAEEDAPEDHAPDAHEAMQDRPPSTSIFDRQDESGEEIDASPARRGLFEQDTPAETTPKTPAEEPAAPENTPDRDTADQDLAEEDETDDVWASTQWGEESTEASSEPADGEETPSGDAPVEESAPRDDREETAAAAGAADPGEHEDWSMPASPTDSSSEVSSSDASSPSWAYAALPAGYLLSRAPQLDADALRSGRLLAPDRETPRSHDDRSPATPDRQPDGDASSGRNARPAEDRPAEDRASAPSDESSRAAPSERSSRGGSGVGWLAALLALLVVGLAAWYVLGQQDVVTGPTALFEQSDDAPAPQQPAAEAGSASSPGPAGAASDTAAAASADAATQAYEDAARIDRAQGGWTVVVASETSRQAARSAAQTIAQQLRGEDLPIDILEASVDGTQRFRVVVGQFSSPDQVNQTLAQNTDRFPPDAWGLQL